MRLLYHALTDDLFAELRLRRKLRGAPAGELVSLRESSFARIAGTVRPLENRLLTAPLSGRRCVYYAVHATVVRGSESHAQGRGIGGYQDAIPFVLDDSTAQAVIDPDHADISVPFDYPSTSQGASYADLEQRRILERERLLHRDWFNTKSLRYRECVIEVDHEIVVFGAGMLEPDPEASPPGMYRQGQPLRLRFAGSAKYPLVIRAPRK
ncbi:MAG TPA: hypothetical protein VLB44_16645 [Kofleriaceae bacterium]|nr:hypothetical protein [Kofleriaceae bacterium]